MKKLLYLTILAVGIASAVIDNSKYYNILSIDGGGIRGLIPLQTIKYMETFAYKYCKEKNYKFPQYTFDNGTIINDGTVAIKDMWDMLAGTSTGSIIAAMLTY